MSDGQLVLISRAELLAVIRQALAEDRAAQKRKSQRTMNADDLAKHYGCSRTTIWRKVKAGQLPQPIGKRWTEAQIARWDNDRMPQNTPHNPA